MPYFIASVIIVLVIALVWLAAWLIDTKVFNSDSEGGAFFVALFVTFVLVLAAPVISFAEIADNEYVDRVEEKYAINVEKNIELDGEDDYVSYANGNCIARRAPDDTLYRMGCVKGGYKELTRNED